MRKIFNKSFLMDDKAILESIQKGRESALKMLIDRYYTTLCAFATHIIKDNDNAEDVVQEVFIRVWTYRRQLSNITSIKDYLFASVRNHSLTFLRGQKRLDNHLKQIPLEEEYISSYLIEEETNRLLLEAISRLSPRSAEVINLSLSGLKQEEIAKQMNITINTVKSLKYEAIEKLKKLLRPLVCWFFIQKCRIYGKKQK